jgi:stage V sporulation protein B
MANKFISGTLILTLSGFVVKAIGSINWIILSRILGGEGIGIYQMAFPIYLLALEISSAGIPIAISIITAEKAAQKDYGGAHRIFNVSLTMLCSTALILSILVFFGARWLIDYQIIRESRAYYSLIALAPAIFFTTIIAGYRGYLQGWQLMTPTALSQIIEQIVRVVVMLAFAAILLPYGLDYAAGGASLGAGAGGIAALLCLLYYYYKLQRSLPHTDTHIFPKESVRHILGRIITLSIPISLASIMLPVVSNLDLLIVPRRLEVAGFSTAQSTELFGYLTGMSVPLINLATILTAAMAMSLVPAISNAHTLHNTQMIFDKTSSAMRVALLATIPFSVMLYVLAEPVVTFIYNAPGATKATQAIAVAIIFLGIHQVTTGILQGLKRPTIPVVNMGIACVVKVACNWFLVAIPALGIAGGSYATVADIGVAAMLNLYFIYRHTGYTMSIKNIGRNIASAVVMGFIMHHCYLFLHAYMGLFLTLLITVLIGSAVYLGLMYIMGGLNKEDVQKMPFFGKYIK